jgi:hypothetical protein
MTGAGSGHASGATGPPAALPGTRDAIPLASAACHLHPLCTGQVIDGTGDPGSSPD